MLKDRVDLYWDMYKFELTTRDSLNSQITLPIAITTVNFGAFTYCIKQLKVVSSIPAAISTFILLCSIIFSVVFIIRGYHNKYIYSLVSSPIIIEEIQSDICRYYSELNVYNNTPDNDNTDMIDEQFNLKLIEVYGKCNDKNISNNTTRSAFLYNAKTAVIVGLIVSAFAVSFCSSNIISDIVHNCFNKISISEVNKNVGKATKTKNTTTTTQINTN